MICQTKWDMRFMRIAQQEVVQWSKDPDAKVGCIIVSPDRRRTTMGYNGFPQGIRDLVSRLEDRDTKNLLSVHAELNAILNARMDLTGWTLYVTKSPCIECAKAVIQAGIVRVVCPVISPLSRWAEVQKQALVLLAEAGVSTTYNTNGELR